MNEEFIIVEKKPRLTHQYAQQFHDWGRRVYAGTRRLNATWTPELAEDLKTYHIIDAEAELWN